MKQLRLLVMLFYVMAGGALALAQDDMTSLADLPADDWTVISPEGDTICSNGTPFSYFVRPNSSESSNLMVYFQGGGACWFGDICNLQVNPTYDPFVDESDIPGPIGIFDFENEENPFAEYSVVFVPYCTADVHIGDSDTTYTDSAGNDVTIFHRGYTNATAALDWTFANFEAPETVFVTGSSAGSIPSPFYAQFVAEAYPDARIEVLGDAAGGYRLGAVGIPTIQAWGTFNILPEIYADYNDDNPLTFEAFYIEVGEEYPEISMTQYNTAADETQVGFLALNGIMVEGTGLNELLEANFADIEARIPDSFDYFTAGGDVHTILLRPEFYTYAIDGTRLVDWVSDLESGEQVETLACMECDLPEEVTGEE